MFDADKLIRYTELYLVPFTINLLVALAIFLGGRWLAKLVVRTLTRLLEKAKLDESLAKFLGSIAYAVLLVIVVLAALERLGVNTTSALAILGAAGIAVGLALQRSLGHFASGVMLIITRPISKGHLVKVGGITGVVDAITVFSTTIVPPDGIEVVVPNGQIYGATITNYSTRGTRRIDLTFGIGYDDDIKRAKEILEGLMANDSRVLASPAPVVAVGKLGDSSVNLVTRPWVEVDDYWDVYFSLTEQAKLAFDEAGISIPYPQRDVHLQQRPAAA